MALVPSRDETDEAGLVEAFRATADSRHFAALYRLAWHRVFGRCLKLLRNAGDAEDATHETFLKAYEQFSWLRGTNFTAWVLTIASNLCLNRIRRERVWARVLERSAPETGAERGGEQAAIAAEEVEIARSILGSLSPEQRKVLLLRYLDECSHHEIESITGYDAEQVRSYLQNGRRNFRIRWSQRTGPRERTEE
jgi:RNA polymerase sigma-70 factor (ECF subfamily)